LPEEQHAAPPNPAIEINEAQFLLAQKRTQLAAVRTGLAVLAVPMSIISLLIVTSRLYHFWDNAWYILPLVAVCLGLIALGCYLIIKSLRHLHRTERGLRALVVGSPNLNNLER